MMHENSFNLNLEVYLTTTGKKLLAEAGVAVEIDTTPALAIKADLAIPWYRIRILRKYVFV